MESLAIIFLLIGLVCCIIELFVPGFGVFGILGGILILLSCVMTILFSPFGLIIVLAELFIGFILFYILIKYMKRKQIFGRIILSDITKNKKEVANLEQFIGKEGIALTALRPFGNAQFNGIILEVVSEGAYISNNKRIKCIRVLDNKLYVKEVNSN